MCPEASRLDFTAAVGRFKEELTALFEPFQYGHGVQLAFYPPELRAPIMDAGRAQKLLEIVYDGNRRLVEPYSLRFKWRKDGAGQEYLYVYDRTGGRSGPGVKSLFNWTMTELTVTDIKFEPRVEVELALPVAASPD